MLVSFYCLMLLLSLVVGIAVTLHDREQRVLGVFCIINASYQGFVILDASATYISPKLYFLLLTLYFLPGPLLLGYVGQLFKRHYLSRRDFITMVIPTMMVLLLGDLISSASIFSLVEREAYEQPSYMQLHRLIAIIIGLHTIFYTLYAACVVYQYREQWHMLESRPLPRSWQKVVVTLVLFVITAAMQMLGAFMNKGGLNPMSMGDVGAQLWLFYISVLGIIHLRKGSAKPHKLKPIPLRKSFSKQLHVEIVTPLELTQDAEKDKKHSTREVEAQPSLSSLSVWIIEEVTKRQLYLDNELSLTSLAQKLEIKPYMLSECLNKEVGGSFYQFINKYRVDSAKEKLKNQQDLSITDIYEACGFSSRSAFYSVFKKYVGCTPSKYRSKVKATN